MFVGPYIVHFRFLEHQNLAYVSIYKKALASGGLRPPDPQLGSGPTVPQTPCRRCADTCTKYATGPPGGPHWQFQSGDGAV